VWWWHVGDPVLASDITHRVDYALFMIEVLTNNALIHEAPAIVGCHAPSALAYAAAQEIYEEEREFRLVFQPRYPTGYPFLS